MHMMLSSIKDKFQSMRSSLYDFLIVSMTSRWYREVLLECAMDCVLLDVGIGTATSLIANRDIVLSKHMHVVGVDYDLDYVRSAQANLGACSLRDAVRVEHASIHDYNKSGKEKFDVIYFSGSFMIIPHQVEALRHCVAMLRSPVPKTPGGCNLFFTQTFERRSFVGRYVTPLLKRLLRLCTTIDFGTVTYEDDFRAALQKAGVEIVEMRDMQKSYFRKEVIVFARPVAASTV